MASVSRLARWIRSPPLTVSRPVSKATSWAGQAARPFRRSRRSAGVLSFQGLMWAARSIRAAPNAAGLEAAEHAPAAAVGQHMLGEHVLPDPDRCQQDSFGLQVRPWAGGNPAGDLLAQLGFEGGDIKFFLTQQSKLAA